MYPLARFMKITKFNLFFWYIIRNKSQRELAKKYSLSRRGIRCHLDRYGIKKCGWQSRRLMKKAGFKKGNTANLGRKRPDMIGNTFWEENKDKGEK